MIADQLNMLRAWFLDYAGGFADADGNLPLPLQMKLDHSARVAEDSRTIARGEGWSDQDVLVAEAIGWLHDVARFSQYKEFKTFHDPRSVNHGERGWSILTDTGVLAACSPQDRQRILEGVRYHNRKAIPEETTPDALRFVKLIRDADKLDIFEIFHHALETDMFASYPEALLHVSKDGPVNSEILKEIRLRNNPSYQHIRTLADFMMIQVSWVHDINFCAAMRLIKERNIIERIEQRLPLDTEVREILADVELYRDGYLAQGGSTGLPAGKKSVLQ